MVQKIPLPLFFPTRRRWRRYRVFWMSVWLLSGIFKDVGVWRPLCCNVIFLTKGWWNKKKKEKDFCWDRSRLGRFLLCVDSFYRVSHCMYVDLGYYFFLWWIDPASPHTFFRYCFFSPPPPHRRLPSSPNVDKIEFCHISVNGNDIPPRQLCLLCELLNSCNLKKSRNLSLFHSWFE